MSLEVNNLKAGYFKDTPILDGVTFRVPERKVTLFIGPNGSGKSTLLKAIMGTITWKRGRIFYNGTEITNFSPAKLIRMGILWVPQDGAVFPHLNTLENILLAGKALGLNTKLLIARLSSLQKEFSIQDKLQLTAGNLSGGEQKLIALARAALLDAQLLLLDEPTAGLSPKLASEYLNHLIKLKDKGVTVVIVEQNVKLAMSIADYVYVMQTGKITHYGTRNEIEERLPTIIQSWLI